MRSGRGSGVERESDPRRMDAVSAVGDVQVRGIGIVGCALGLSDIGTIDAARWTGAWRAGVVMSAELLDGLLFEDSW